MKILTATALLFVGSSVAFAQSPAPPNDRGWMAFFVGDACQLGRHLAGPGDGRSGLAIAILSNPHDHTPPAAGKTLLTASVIKDGKPQSGADVSFTLVAGGKTWKLSRSELGLHYIVGEEADAARASFLSEPVTLQVVQSDGNSQTFAIHPKGFKVANATFNACVAELSQDKPLQPSTR